MTPLPTIRLSTIYARDLLRFFDRDKLEESRRVSRHLNSVVTNCPDALLPRHVFDSLTIAFHRAPAQRKIGNSKLDGAPTRGISDDGHMRSTFPRDCCHELKEASGELIGELIVPAIPSDVVVEISAQNLNGGESVVNSFAWNRLDDAESVFNCLHYLSHIADCTWGRAYVEFGPGVELCCVHPLLNPLIVRRLREWRAMGSGCGLLRCWELSISEDYNDKVIAVLYRDGTIPEDLFQAGSIQILDRIEIIGQHDYDVQNLFSVAGKFCRVVHVRADPSLTIGYVDRLIEVVLGVVGVSIKEVMNDIKPAFKFIKDHPSNSEVRLPSKVEFLPFTYPYPLREWPKSIPSMEKRFKTEIIEHRSTQCDHFQLVNGDGAPFTVTVERSDRMEDNGPLSIVAICVMLRADQREPAPLMASG